MTENLRTLEVNQGSKIAEILEDFESGNQDLLVIDQATVVTKPHLELLTDYPRTVTTALVSKMVAWQYKRQCLCHNLASAPGPQAWMASYIRAAAFELRQR